jgi:hypothetical protein
MTTKTEAAEIDIADLDTCAQCDTPFEFEYQRPDGSGSGVFLSVLGSQSAKVTSEINRLINARREKSANRAVGGRHKTAEFDPIEDDIAFGQRLSAVRLVGWRGIKQAYSPELALKLCQSNSLLSGQVLEASNDLGNFTPASRKA